MCLCFFGKSTFLTKLTNMLFGNGGMANRTPLSVSSSAQSPSQSSGIQDNITIGKEYDTIDYHPGKTNENANSLSRITILPTAANITFVKQENWVESQQGDE